MPGEHYWPSNDRFGSETEEAWLAQATCVSRAMAKASYTTHCSPTPRFTHPRRDCGPHQSRTRNDLNKPQRTQPNSNENVEESTKPTIVLPLITVWLQVRVLPGPPKINSLGRFHFAPSEAPHQKRLSSLLLDVLQQSTNYRCASDLATMSPLDRRFGGFIAKKAKHRDDYVSQVSACSIAVFAPVSGPNSVEEGVLQRTALLWVLPGRKRNAAVYG
ncbi:hypothetical protein V1286_005599 [Bradyrhizobium algeriense]|uniref:Uncharacterized protein n=1 Tax=Bradyrhizobium algeriense TaxID=634784 RepID=A0ABU8BHQ1_9BRAD